MTQLATSNSQPATTCREDLSDAALIEHVAECGPSDSDLVESVRRGRRGRDLVVLASIWLELEILERRLLALGAWADSPRRHGGQG